MRVVFAVIFSSSITALAVPNADAPDGPPIAIANVSRSDKVDFEHEILPILRDNCLACHNRTRSKADLILETPADILKGGENGPAVVAGKSKESFLLNVTAHRVNPVMPPKENKVSAHDLTPTQLGLIRLWIDQGAKGEVHGAITINWQPPAPSLEPIYAAAITADGRFAAAGRANHVDLYDLLTLQPLTSLADPRLPGAVAHREMVESLAFSPDCTELVSGGYAEVNVWKRTPAAKKWFIPLPSESIHRIAVSPDGKWVAIAIQGRPTQMIDAATGATIRSLDASTSSPVALQFSADGAKLALASADQGVRICDREGKLISQFVSPIDVASLEWQESHLLLTGHERTNYIWSPTLPLAPVSSGERSGVNVSLPRRVTITPDGQNQLWDTAKKSPIASLDGDAESSRKLAKSERELELAKRSVAFHHTVEQQANAARNAAAARVTASNAALSKAQQALAAKQKNHDDAATAVKATNVKLTRDDIDLVLTIVSITNRPKLFAQFKTIAALKGAATKSEAALKAIDTELPPLQLAASNAQTEAKLAAAADAAAEQEVKAAREAAVTAEHDLERRTDETKQAKATAAAQRLRAQCVAFSPDGRTIATVTGAAAIYLWSANNGAAMDVIRCTRPVSFVAFCGDKLLAAGVDGTELWSPGGKWKFAASLSNPTLVDRVTALAFSPDGKRLATGSGEPTRNGRIAIWDTASLQLVRDIPSAHSDCVLALQFSPDGKQLASGGADRMAKIFDAASGSLVHTLEGHSGHVLGVSWRADGLALATSGTDGHVRFWNTLTGDRLQAAALSGKEIDAACYLGLTSDVLTAAGDGQLRIVNEGAAVGQTLGEGSFIHACAVTPDGKLVIAGGEDGTLIVLRDLKATVEKFPAPKR